jgi:hypothetical protein
MHFNDIMTSIAVDKPSMGDFGAHVPRTRNWLSALAASGGGEYIDIVTVALEDELRAAAWEPRPTTTTTRRPRKLVTRNASMKFH